MDHLRQDRHGASLVLSPVVQVGDWSVEDEIAAFSTSTAGQRLAEAWASARLERSRSTVQVDDEIVPHRDEIEQ